MVAYSFHKVFAPQVERGSKCQTIRRDRRRHARPGEPLQLYTGMRTRACRKLVAPDPVCLAVGEVRFDLRDVDAAAAGRARDNDALMAAIAPAALTVNGIPVVDDERHLFASRDGFAGLWIYPGTGGDMQPFAAMTWFWLEVHGPVLFEGVLVQWQDFNRQGTDR